MPIVSKNDTGTWTLGQIYNIFMLKWLSLWTKIDTCIFITNRCLCNLRSCEYLHRLCL